MRTLALRIVSRRRSRRVCIAKVASPVEGVLHFAAVLENFTAVSRPEHHGGAFASPQQSRPGLKNLFTNCFHSRRFERPKRLQTDLESDTAESGIRFFVQRTDTGVRGG